MPDFRVRTRVLLTRSPLPLRGARLACLIHTASVHPGPGSNPLKKEFELSFKPSIEGFEQLRDIILRKKRHKKIKVFLSLSLGRNENKFSFRSSLSEIDWDN